MEELSGRTVATKQNGSNGWQFPLSGEKQIPRQEFVHPPQPKTTENSAKISKVKSSSFAREGVWRM
jgi:hypothetical protein